MVRKLKEISSKEKKKRREKLIEYYEKKISEYELLKEKAEKRVMDNYKLNKKEAESLNDYLFKELPKNEKDFDTLLQEKLLEIKKEQNRREVLNLIESKEKYKLEENKTEQIIFRVTKTEKQIVEELKKNKIDYVEEIRNLILNLNKDITKKFLNDEYQKLKENLNKIEIEIVLCQSKRRKKLTDKEESFNLKNLIKLKNKIEKYLIKLERIFKE